MIVKKNVVLTREGIAGKRELLMAEVFHSGKLFTVKTNKEGTVGLLTETGANFSPLSGGNAEFVFDGEPMCVGLFENGTLAFYGETGKIYNGKQRLKEAFARQKQQDKTVTGYDDFAIAESNYYNENSPILCDLGDLLKNNTNVTEISDVFKPNVSEENDSAQTKEEHGKETERNENIYIENENGERRDKTGGRKGYYEEIKPVLQSVFYKFPHEKHLENAVSGGTFVKILYADNKYYVVGMTKENGLPEYVVFGLPSAEGNNPPKEIKGKAWFVPTGKENNGFFLLYRDAYTGDVLTPPLNIKVP